MSIHLFGKKLYKSNVSIRILYAWNIEEVSWIDKDCEFGVCGFPQEFCCVTCPDLGRDSLMLPLGFGTYMLSTISIAILIQYWGLWLTDIAHYHLAIAIIFLIAGHMYRSNWSTCNTPTQVNLVIKGVLIVSETIVQSLKAAREGER
ncbi:hypothetical protein M9H77_14046 [Catharanthus roseus]|uniref:Uncharacterized protein n=1 Tax=Catharanthus roseus TaxID=4058 RepID=A0ACC0BM37_CATRO|nr:hypothetical protein M9H77_14046 [Catharanthus roseus]